MTTVLFYIFSVLLLGSSLFVVLNRNPVYSIAMLVFGFANLAGIYFLLEATFIGALQILVYAGAIMVLFLFVVMLLQVEPDKPRKGPIRVKQWWYGVMAVLFLALMLFMVHQGVSAKVVGLGVQSAENGNVATIAMAIFNQYLLPFELASILLTVALVGAIFLAKRRI